MDGINDLFAVMNAGENVAWRNPATDAVGLELAANRIGYRFITRGIADEDVVRHGTIPFEQNFRFGATGNATTIHATLFSGNAPLLPEKALSGILVSAISKEKLVPVARRRGAWYKLRVPELPTWSRTPRLVPSLRRSRRSHCAASLGVGG